MTVTPKEREGVRRFIADYKASTRYRVMVPAGKAWEPHPTLPAYPTWTEAELAAIKIAGPTRVDAEKGADVTDREAVGGDSTARASAPLFCQCGHPEDEHYQGSVCTKIEGMYVCGCDTFIAEAA